MIHTCLRIRVPNWCTHFSYFPSPSESQRPNRDDTNNIPSCSENKSNEKLIKSPKRVKKNNHRCPRLAKIDTSSLGAVHRVTRSSYRLIQNLFIQNWDKWPTRPDPESEECCDGLSDGKSSLPIQRFLTHICSSSKMFSL